MQSVLITKCSVMIYKLIDQPYKHFADALKKFFKSDAIFSFFFFSTANINN